MTADLSKLAPRANKATVIRILDRTVMLPASAKRYKSISMQLNG